jgi:transcriptional regulator with XRE-family HTH domain
MASLHRTEVGTLERGERIPRIDTVVKLATVLEIEVGELVAGIEWRPPPAGAGQFRHATDETNPSPGSTRTRSSWGQ